MTARLRLMMALLSTTRLLLQHQCSRSCWRTLRLQR
jgi:hypothetical protein